jgi:hypothetical protein
MKSKILHESSTKSGEETETSSHTQEQFKKDEDSTAGGSYVESSFSVEIKVILIPLTTLSLLIILQSPSFQMIEPTE